MKRKVVINVPMYCRKCYTKALTIVVGVSGVESAALKGDDNSKSQIEVIGEVDPVELVTSLRKKLPIADLVSVGPAGGGEKKDKKEKEDQTEKKGKEDQTKKNDQKDKQPLAVQPLCGMPCNDYCVVCVEPYSHSRICSIM